MIRWQLMLEEFHSKVLHVAGKENDTADFLSRLDMPDNPSDEMEWPLPSLTYQDEVRERIQQLFPLAAEKELKPSTKFPLAPDLVRYYQQRDKTANTTSYGGICSTPRTGRSRKQRSRQ